MCNAPAQPVQSRLGGTMPLTNSQHAAIMRIYNNIQTKNRHIHEERVDEVYRSCPDILATENEIIDLSAKSAPDIIRGDENTMRDYRMKLSELSAKRDSLLKASGFPEDYLEPVYDCAKCRDTGLYEGKPCECFKRKVVDLFYMRSNLKNIVAEENFSTFSFDWYSKDYIDEATGLTAYDNMKNVVSICRQFIREFDKGFHNLLIYGKTGVGKTFLSNCIAKELLDTSHSVIYLTAIELFEAFGNYNNDDDYEGTAIESILGCDLLIIDDLGTELGNTFTNSKLFYCINERMLRRKASIISTNLNLRELSGLYSERIMSRITSAYTLLKLFGNDIRIQKTLSY